jgi:hypothetical protein
MSRLAWTKAKGGTPCVFASAVVALQRWPPFSIPHLILNEHKATPMYRPALHLSLVALTLLALVGCGGNTGTVTGKVSYKGQPVPGGNVVFTNADQSKTERAPIQSDGTYTSSQIPVGEMLVGVEPPPQGPRAKMPPGAKMPDLPPDSPGMANYAGGGGAQVDIPASLQNPKTSGYTTTVSRGSQTFDIDLKDPN